MNKEIIEHMKRLNNECVNNEYLTGENLKTATDAIVALFVSIRGGGNSANILVSQFQLLAERARTTRHKGIESGVSIASGMAAIASVLWELNS